MVDNRGWLDVLERSEVVLIAVIVTREAYSSGINGAISSNSFYAPTGVAEAEEVLGEGAWCSKRPEYPVEVGGKFNLDVDDVLIVGLSHRPVR
jgi:hypothetical protein